MARSIATNTQVAEFIGGITAAQISRIRSGDRYPSLNLMYRIQILFGWDMNSQSASWAASRYKDDFEDVLCERFDTA